MPTSIARCRCGKTKRLRGHRRHFTCPDCLAERARERAARARAEPVLLPHPHLLVQQAEQQEEMAEQGLERPRRLADEDTCGPGPATVVFHGSDGAATRRTLRELEARGQPGRIAAALFRAMKTSAQAKVYRGGPDGSKSSYTDLAYRNKGLAIAALCRLLAADSAGLAWGWGRDGATDFAPHVMYLDLPTGQVSFHSTDRFVGPDYGGAWDGVRDVSAARILAWCDQLLAAPAGANEGGGS